ncbi:MAG: glycosyltransferase family 39 protein [Candidatus Micrarchaeota archaeon]|nr:glycosyltransferase family 39 protein [Candidatus Micrarchaeota archaeon]
MDSEKTTTVSHEHSHHSGKFDLRQSILSNGPILLLFLAISLVVFWPLAVNMATTTVNGAGDLYQNLWNLWWVNYATYTLHTSIYFTPLLYYPVGGSLVTQTLSPITAYLSFPFQAISLVFSYNIMLFLAFMLSGFFMFLLAEYLVKNRHAAIIAGLIFAFAPMHMAQALSGHLNWTNVEFLPLFILFFFKMINEKKLLYSLGAAVSFVFMLFMGDPEQGIITVVLVFFMLLVYLIRSSLRKEILNKQFGIAFGGMIVLILVVGSPFLIQVAPAITNGQLSQAASALNDVNHNMLWSMPVISFLAPSLYNNLFSWLSNSYISIYSVDPTERVAYLGYVALVLALIGIWHDYKKQKLANTLVWVVAAIIFGWLSLGPYVQLGNLQASSIPGIYLIYAAIPFFNIIREPARFDMILTLALAILAAYGFHSLIEGKKAKNTHSAQSEKYLAAILSVLILIEYAGIPLTSGYLGTFYTTTTIPPAYAQLGTVPGNFSVLMLPAIQGSGASRPEYYVGLSMYYQTAFHKPILSGYTSRVNDTELLPSLSIPLALSASYLQEGQGLVYPSPILQNNSNVTLYWLAQHRTAFISIIRQAYNLSQIQQLGSYLVSVFGDPVYQDNTTIIFSAINATRFAGVTMVAYTDLATWYPGYSFCQATLITCNATFGSIWWGPNVRSIDIYSPTQRVVNMSFEGIAYQGTMPLYFYLNSASTQFAHMQLNTTLSNYTISLPLSAGNNYLFLVTQNVTQGNPYLNFGMKNITFTAK